LPLVRSYQNLWPRQRSIFKVQILGHSWSNGFQKLGSGWRLKDEKLSV
jgi:hypothetical protein